jgi:hypothetical protein
MHLRYLITATGLFGSMLFASTAVLAQESSPAASPTPIACTVQPRDPAELATLQATPEAAGTPAIDLISAKPVDDPTLIALQAVVLEADLCAQAGDFDRLAALYSDHAIESGVLDDEAVIIQPGTPAATPPSTNNPPSAPGTVTSAVLMADGRALAFVERGDTIYQVVLVQIDGQWLLDSNEMLADQMIDDSAGGPGTPSDSGDTVPLDVLEAVITQISGITGEEVDTVTIVSYEAVEWNDSFLGCPVAGEYAAQVITPGYRIIAEYEGQQYEIHTDLQGRAVSCVGGH